MSIVLRHYIMIASIKFQCSLLHTTAASINSQIQMSDAKSKFNSDQIAKIMYSNMEFRGNYQQENKTSTKKSKQTREIEKRKLIF